MKKITVYYSIGNGGDGSAYLDWYLTLEEVENDQEEMDEGWGEPCYGSVETYEGSDIHKEAKKNAE